jgi:hypothetical protein
MKRGKGGRRLYLANLARQSNSHKKTPKNCFSNTSSKTATSPIFFREERTRTPSNDAPGVNIWGSGFYPIVTAINAPRPIFFRRGILPHLYDGVLPVPKLLVVTIRTGSVLVTYAE